MSERYQSKVFNFLWRQYLRLQDQSAQTWRSAKVAAVWGAQILLYPIYVGFQTTRLAGKQLQHTARQTLPRLRAVKQTLQHGIHSVRTNAVADTPIQHTLQAIAALDVELPNQDVLLLPAEANFDLERIERELAVYVRHHAEDAERQGALAVATPVALQAREPVASAPEVSAIRIQGVASTLDTRSLVLVTTRNQILDVLSREQQTQLAQRVIRETAHYWRQRRLLGTPGKSLLVSNYLPLPKVQNHALLPIRVFRQVMSWMQRGPVAASANLFQESQLQLSLPAVGSLPASDPTLRSAQPAWIAMEVKFYDWLERVGQTSSNWLISGVEAGLAAIAPAPQTPAALQPAPLSDPTLLSPRPAAPPHWLSQLDQWLSKIPGWQNPVPVPSTKLLTASDPAGSTSSIAMAASDTREGWLKRSLRQILPSNSALTAIKRSCDWELVDTAAIETAIKTRLSKLYPVPPESSALMPSPTSALQNRNRAPVSADGVPIAISRYEPLEPPLSSLDTANLEEAAMMPQTWIETEAQLVSYVKHPLEQLLDWLDKGMTWLEQQVAKIWRLLSQPMK